MTHKNKAFYVKASRYVSYFYLFILETFISLIKPTTSDANLTLNLEGKVAKIYINPLNLEIRKQYWLLKKERIPAITCKRMTNSLCMAAINILKQNLQATFKMALNALKMRSKSVKD